MSMSWLQLRDRSTDKYFTYVHANTKSIKIQNIKMTKVHTLVAKELRIMESGQNRSQSGTECGKQWDKGVTFMCSQGGTSCQHLQQGSSSNTCRIDEYKCAVIYEDNQWWQSNYINYIHIYNIYNYRVTVSSLETCNINFTFRPLYIFNTLPRCIFNPCHSTK